MSIKSPKAMNWERTPSERIDIEEMHSDKVLKFSYASFKSERVYFAKKQIEQLISKMLICPEKKSYFIQEINKLILYELSENKFE